MTANGVAPGSGAVCVPNGAARRHTEAVQGAIRGQALAATSARSPAIQPSSSSMVR